MAVPNKDLVTDKPGLPFKPNSALYPGSLDVRRAFDHTEENINRASPFAKWELIPVTFPATANLDVVIRHNLNPDDPESVIWTAFNFAETATPPATAAYIYRDISGTKRPWQSDYIILRSRSVSFSCILLLALPRKVSNAAQTNL